MKYGCKECRHSSIVMRRICYPNGMKKRAAVVTCPFEACPYFETGKYKSFKEYLESGDWKAAFEIDTGLDMNDLRHQPGDMGSVLKV